MAKASGKIKIQICITMSLWDAIKLRIAGKAARDLVEDLQARMDESTGHEGEVLDEWVGQHPMPEPFGFPIRRKPAY